MMKTGVKEELALNNFQTTLNDSDVNRIHKIEYTWKLYENVENVLIFYRFKFYGKPKDDEDYGPPIAVVQNLTDVQYARAITRDGFKFIRKSREYQYIDPERETIVALKIGVRSSGSLVNIQFIIGVNHYDEPQDQLDHESESIY